MQVPRYEVVVSAGTLRPEPGTGVVMAHRWTPEGVVVEAEFTGAHLYVLSAAGCVLNDLFREGSALGLEVLGARVRAHGGFDPDTWSSTGVEYEIDLDVPAPGGEVERLIEIVVDVAEIPKALRGGAPVTYRGRVT